MLKNSKDKFSLNLNRSLSSSFSGIEQNNLQKEVFYHVQKLLTKFCTEVSENELSITFGLKRKNNVIYVHGTRGAGKTTFLREVLTFYQNTQISENRQNINRIYPVAFIDPTLIDGHQSILVDIFAHFYSLVDEKRTFCQNPEKRIEFYKLLDLLSKGIELFISSDVKDIEHDNSGLLSRIKNKSMLGDYLEKKIHILLDEVSKVLNIELFIIAIDDIDTNTDKAYAILEAIRCYLNHPRLAIIISGDLNMYSYIVRNKKSQELSTKDDINKVHVNELITHLEQQYLSKVFPIEQRIVLKKMDELVSKSNQIYVIHDYLSDDSWDNEICQLLNSIFTQSLGIEKQYLALYVKFILNQPIRSILQFIKTMIEGMKDGLFTSRALEQSLYHIFIGDIADEGVSTNSLSAYDIHPVGYALFKLILQHNDLETGFYACPDGYKGKNSYNATKLYLSASAINLDNQLSNSLNMMLLVGASSNIYTNYVKNHEQAYCHVENYIDYIGLNRNDRMSRIAARFSPIILQSQLASTHHKAILCGVIETFCKSDETRFNSSAFLKLLEKHGLDNPKRISSLQQLTKKLATDSQLDLYQYTALATITMSAHRTVTVAEQHDYISMYKLIASIAELLSGETIKIADLLTLANDNYPNFLTDTLKDHRKLMDDEHEGLNATQNRSTDKATQHITRLSELLSSWGKNSKGLNIKMPLLLSGKIWTGIFYALRAISDDLESKQTHQESLEDGMRSNLLLGDAFSCFVSGMINAVLVQEICYRQNIYSEALINIILNSKNMAISGNELSYNLHRILAEFDSSSAVESIKCFLPLTYILLSCPLLWPFLNDKKQVAVLSLILGGDGSDFYNMVKSHIFAENKAIIVSALPIRHYQ